MYKTFERMDSAELMKHIMRQTSWKNNSRKTKAELKVWTIKINIRNLKTEERNYEVGRSRKSSES